MSLKKNKSIFVVTHVVPRSKLRAFFFVIPFNAVLTEIQS